eukprot:7324314-Ditylum_brightwellii.AAC.1
MSHGRLFLGCKSILLMWTGDMPSQPSAMGMTSSCTLPFLLQNGEKVENLIGFLALVPAS